MTSGVFPVNNLDIKVAEVGSSNYVAIADMESADIAVETGVEEWYSITDGGWKKALATSKAFTMSMAGKRHVGDAGNDLIANKWNKNGQDCNVDVRVTFPNGDILQFTAIASISSIWGAEGTAVAPLEFDLIANGEPVFTLASA